MANYTQVQYQCSYCGTTTTRSASAGRPSPGICTRKGKTKDGKTKPHTWVINKKW